MVSYDAHFGDDVLRAWRKIPSIFIAVSRATILFVSRAANSFFPSFTNHRSSINNSCRFLPLAILHTVNENPVELAEITGHREASSPRCVNCERGSRCFIQAEMNFTCLRSRIISGIEDDGGAGGRASVAGQRQLFFAPVSILFIFISACLIAENLRLSLFVPTPERFMTLSASQPC